jgi:hypothetical protein
VGVGFIMSIASGIFTGLFSFLDITTFANISGIIFIISMIVLGVGFCTTPDDGITFHH